jgi:uncharacterized coiled-coil protein SlyX
VQEAVIDEDTVAELEEKLRQGEKREFELRESNSKLQEEIFQLRDENSVKAAQLASLTEVSSAHEKRASQLENKLTLEERQVADLKKKLADAMSGMTSQQKHVRELLQRCDEQGRLLSEQDVKINSLTEQARSAQMDQLKDSPEFIDLMTEYFFGGFMSLKRKISSAHPQLDLSTFKPEAGDVGLEEFDEEEASEEEEEGDDGHAGALLREGTTDRGLLMITQGEEGSTAIIDITGDDEVPPPLAVVDPAVVLAEGIWLNAADQLLEEIAEEVLRNSPPSTDQAVDPPAHGQLPSADQPLAPGPAEENN